MEKIIAYIFLLAWLFYVGLNIIDSRRFMRFLLFRLDLKIFGIDPDNLPKGFIIFARAVLSFFFLVGLLLLFGLLAGWVEI